MVLRRLLQVCFSTRIARQPDNVIRSVWELCYNWGYAFAMKYLYVFTYFVIKLRQKNNIKFTLNESILITLFESTIIRGSHIFLQRISRFSLLCNLECNIRNIF